MKEKEDVSDMNQECLDEEGRGAVQRRNSLDWLAWLAGQLPVFPRDLQGPWLQKAI